MKVMTRIYLVINVEDEGPARIEKAFTSREKAEQYKLELEDEFKDNIRFQYKFWHYEIEELEVN